MDSGLGKVLGGQIGVQSQHRAGEERALVAGCFVDAELLVEEMADLFDQGLGKKFLRAGARKENGAQVPAIAAPEAGHRGAGEPADGREVGEIGVAEAVEPTEGGSPVQFGTKNGFQIRFRAWGIRPIPEGEKERGDFLGLKDEETVLERHAMGN